MTRVLISASSPVVRAGLASLLSADPTLEITGDSDSHASLDEQISAARPDVIVLVMDSFDDDEEGLLAAPLADPAPGNRLAWVVLVDDLERAQAMRALQSGVRSLLPRDAAVNEIQAAIRAAAAGLIVLRPETLDELQPAPDSSSRTPRIGAGQGEYPAASQALTAREIEVLRMLAEGLGNKEIAWRLKISEHTVKFHISSIFAKLDASSRTEAVTLGIRLGLIML